MSDGQWNMCWGLGASTNAWPSSLCLRASLVAQLVKNPPAMWETSVQSLSGKIPWRRERLLTPIFSPGEFHGLCSSWGHKKSDMTEQLSLTCTWGPRHLRGSGLVFQVSLCLREHKIQQQIKTPWHAERGNMGACMLSCVWLCDPMDCSPLGSFIHGIFQARIVE